MLPVLTVLRPVKGASSNVTFSCEVYRLDPQQISSYKLRWKFHDKEIKEDDLKYKIFWRYFTPNSCQQSKGLAALSIANVSKEDLGQYKCVLQMSGITLAEKDVFFFAGKLYVCVGVDFPPKV